LKAKTTSLKTATSCISDSTFDKARAGIYNFRSLNDLFKWRYSSVG
jgi:hypothetical protein